MDAGGAQYPVSCLVKNDVQRTLFQSYQRSDLQKYNEGKLLKMLSGLVFNSLASGMAIVILVASHETSHVARQSPVQVGEDPVTSGRYGEYLHLKANEARASFDLYFECLLSFC